MILLQGFYPTDIKVSLVSIQLPGSQEEIVFYNLLGSREIMLYRSGYHQGERNGQAARLASHMMKGGTIVYATIINAHSSMKNAWKKYDPEMHQTKKGNE